MRRSRVRLVLSSLLGFFLLTALIAYAGVDQLAEVVRNANPWLVVAAFATYAAFFVLRGARWSILLRPVKRGVPASETTLLTALGWLINTYVPMKAGDVARAALLHRRHRVSFVASASTVAVERTLDLFGLAALASIGLLALPHGRSFPPLFERALEVAWVLPLGIITTIFIATRRREAFLLGCHGALRWLPQGLRDKLMRLAASVLTGSEAIAKQPRLLLTVLPLTMMQAAAQAGIFVILFLAFVPDASVALLVAGVPFFLLSFIIAVTPGNVGTYEAAFAAVFTALGFPAAIVIPIAVLTHVSTTLFVTVLGSLSIPLLGLTAERVRAEAAAAPTPATTGVET